jgi:serine/threonine protein kinase
VVHRDLKLENLLMSDASARANLKVTDFGLSTFVASDTEVMTDIVGSAWYTAPEVLQRRYHKQVGCGGPACTSSPGQH